jgi:hypothetical protein
MLPLKGKGLTNDPLSIRVYPLPKALIPSLRAVIPPFVFMVRFDGRGVGGVSGLLLPETAWAGWGSIGRLWAHF